jgi:hypothetical protein
MDWKMVWEEILIGFTVAGFVAVLVPAKLWEAVFLIDAGSLPGWLVALENAAVAPLVAAATFIGSMGNIPLATVLNANGVMFAGIMGFIYSDLMVPPLVAINAKYYGKRIALYIAGVMFISIIVTALTLHATFHLLAITPHQQHAMEEVSRFQLDYTFYLNLAMLAVAGLMVWLHRSHVREHLRDGAAHRSRKNLTVKRLVVYLMMVLVLGGLAVSVVTA